MRNKFSRYPRHVDKLRIHPKHFLCCSLCSVAQLCLSLCNPMDCSPTGSSVYGDSPGKKTGESCHAVLQGIFPTRGWTQVSCITDRFFTVWATRETQEYWSGYSISSPVDLPDPGVEPGSSALQVDSLPAKLPGKPKHFLTQCISRMQESSEYTYLHPGEQCPSLSLLSLIPREFLLLWENTN